MSTNTKYYSKFMTIDEFLEFCNTQERIFLTESKLDSVLSIIHRDLFTQKNLYTWPDDKDGSHYHCNIGYHPEKKIPVIVFEKAIFLPSSLPFRYKPIPGTVITDSWNRKWKTIKLNSLKGFPFHTDDFFRLKPHTVKWPKVEQEDNFFVNVLVPQKLVMVVTNIHGLREDLEEFQNEPISFMRSLKATIDDWHSKDKYNVISEAESFGNYLYDSEFMNITDFSCSKIYNKYLIVGIKCNSFDTSNIRTTENFFREKVYSELKKIQNDRIIHLKMMGLMGENDE